MDRKDLLGSEAMVRRKGISRLVSVAATVVRGMLLLVLAHPVAMAADSCGNGVLDRDEACDDGNRVAGDCCSPTCTIEETDLGCAGACRCATCDDGIDNDGDGRIDAEDPECATLADLQRFAWIDTGAFSVAGTAPSPAVGPRGEGEPAAALGLVCSAPAPEASVCDAAGHRVAGAIDGIRSIPGVTVEPDRDGASIGELSFGSGSQVVDVGSLAVAPGEELVLHGEADSVVVIRVESEVRFGRGAGVRLAGKLVPERVLWVLLPGSSLDLDADVYFVGTVLADDLARVSTGERVTWDGAALGATGGRS